MMRFLSLIFSTLYLSSCSGGSGNSDPESPAPIPVPPPSTDTTLFGKTVLVGNVEVNDSYNRNQQYPTWDDSDGDCISNRHEILMAQHIDDESSYPLVMRDDGCAVISGKWLDPYDNKYYYSASDVQIDHVVALYESHISGSGNFTSSEQRLYANTGDKIEGTLPETSHQFLAVGGSSNQAKGSKDPKSDSDGGWMPDNDDFHCTYLKKWVEVKYLNGIYFDREEYDFIKDFEADCSNDPLPNLPEN